MLSSLGTWNCFAGHSATVDFSIAPYLGPQHGGHKVGDTYVEIGDNYHFEQVPEYTPWTMTAQVAAVVGSNGTNGLGLIRVQANASERDDSVLIHSGPDIPPFLRLPVSASGTWSDTLTLPPGTVDPVYLKLEVSGVEAIGLRNDEFTQRYTWPIDYNFHLPITSQVSATLSLQAPNSYSVAGYSRGNSVYPPTGISEEHNNWLSFNANPINPLSELSEMEFHGIALLALYPARVGDPSVRHFDLIASVNITVANATGGVDLGHTVSFLGVTDANGVPIPGATFDSGLLPASVPEPSTLLLAAIGIAGAVSAAVRRRTSTIRLLDIDATASRSA